ncbi:MAG: hypothetical protein M0P01_12605 [Treponema sp.]|nr:hypothetical protein [Treponema sp.]
MIPVSLYDAASAHKKMELTDPAVIIKLTSFPQKGTCGCAFKIRPVHIPYEKKRRWCPADDHDVDYRRQLNIQMSMDAIPAVEEARDSLTGYLQNSF